MDTITGTIRSMKGPYRDGWTILQVHPHGTVTGNLANLQVGDIASFQGEFKTHPTYGKQFVAKFASLDVPRDKDGIREYLQRSFKWIGPVLADELVETFGENLFSVLESSPQSLCKIHGITPERAKEIHEEYLAVQCEYRGEPFEAAYNVKFLQDAVAASSSEKLRFSWIDNFHGGYLTEPENEGVLWLVMPMVV